MASRHGISVLRILISALVLLFIGTALMQAGGGGLELFGNIINDAMSSIDKKLDNAIEDSSPDNEPPQEDTSASAPATRPGGSLTDVVHVAPTEEDISF